MASPANVVSSSATLWATASKEWVIQPKPKPGRKPKKDPAPVKDDGEVDSKGRRTQNRAAQRAFRERKQSQLAELQARVQSYEQGEIERNVALQNIAKRLKEENEALRRENLLLKEKVTRYEDDGRPREGERKRWRDASPASTSSSLPPVKKRSKLSTDSPKENQLGCSYISSPPSMVSSPDSYTSDNRVSPAPFEAQTEPQTPLNNLITFSTSGKGGNMENISFFDCGFCNEDTPCVCREIALQHAADRVVAADLKIDGYNHSPSMIDTNPSMSLESLPPPTPSILDNLPAYQPAVPLRRRPTGSTPPAIFPITAPTRAYERPAPANCSGDPRNCMACADDSFGKAFCTAIEESMSSQPPCADCPSQVKTGNSISFRSHPPRPSPPISTTSAALPPIQITPETIPTNDAWRRIKSHPNVAFTDLSLLADVVARRSKCTGPRVVISPAPGTITPERMASPSSFPSSSEQGPVLLTDPHAHYHEKERARSNGPSSPPELVPQEVLIECARQRVRVVHVDGVREALRLLDSKFSQR